MHSPLVNERHEDDPSGLANSEPINSQSVGLEVALIKTSRRSKRIYHNYTNEIFSVKMSTEKKKMLPRGSKT